MPREPDRTPSPHQTLLALRIIWGAMLMGQVLFFLAVAFLIPMRQRSIAEDLHPLLGYIGLGALLLAVVGGYFIRGQIYKANWREYAITPRGYALGNVLLLALLEIVAFYSILSLLLTGHSMPELLPAIGAVIFQAINIPTGRPMQPHEPHDIRGPGQ